MKKGKIIIITGPPATGKSTISSLVAENSDLPKSVHMHTDDFYHYIKKGVTSPSLPESNVQNEVVIEAFLKATKTFAHNEYEVIVDGIIGPWFLDPWVELAKENYEVHYLILRASKDITMKRALERIKLDESTNVELVETMWNQFTNLNNYENNVINTTNQTIDQTLQEIRQRIRNKENCLD